jgi:hypothetical protein
MAEDAIRLVLEDCAARGDLFGRRARVSARSPSPIGCTAATEVANLQL